MMLEKFDFDEAVKALQSDQNLTGDDGILTYLIKQPAEALLEGEIGGHLAEEVLANRNRRSGKPKKNS